MQRVFTVTHSSCCCYKLIILSK